MRHVLLIAYLFPPLANSGTQRPLKFANHLPEFGWVPTVLTVNAPSSPTIDEALLREVRPGMRVVRAEMLNDSIGRRIGAMASRFADPARVAKAVSWRLRSLFQIPDPYRLWLPNARAAALKIYREAPFDVVLATGYPWTSLLLGRDVARLTGRPFVADFRDPWTREDLFSAPSSGLRNWHERRLERSVLRSAAAVVSVTETMTELMRSLYDGIAPSKFVTITNGYDPGDLDGASLVVPPAHGTIRLVYTGVWKDGYNLEPLYRAIADLQAKDPKAIENLEVIAAGFSPGPAARFGVARHVRELGPISHADALGYMKSAQVLFLPHADGVRRLLALPGKVFEYLAVGASILALCEPRGETQRLLENAGGALLIHPNDEESLRRGLLQLCSSGRLAATERRASVLVQFERRTLSASLAQLLDSVVESTHRPLEEPLTSI